MTADLTLLRFTLTPSDTKRLRHLSGTLNTHFVEIESALSVSIKNRGAEFQIAGKNDAAQNARWVLERLYGEAKNPLSLEDVQLTLAEVKSNHLKATATRNKDTPDLHTRQLSLKARTQNQEKYLKAIGQNDITFGIGPAGTGKTYLAVASAVDALERDAVQRIVLVRPAVEAGERLGFLPGDMAQKVDPYLRPLYDALYDLLGFDRTLKYIERQVIEIAPLAYMRGRTLNGAFIILDEAQNTTPEQMKMFLTRVGFGARVVVTGDTTQIDLARGQRSGLIDAETILRAVSGIAFVRFSSADVVRHPVVARIVEAYTRHEKKQASSLTGNPTR
ncbi:MAG: PhoH family protein [Burkholderiales bacterium]|jgi:phosphate starvation-inducible PhoH-like protein|nr:PhoH family protein [Burkholderiales bacterium]